MQSHLPKVLTVCKRRAAAVGPRPGAYLSGVAVQPARSLCCSVQSSGRSSSVSRVAVSATGCRPCKIASISSGLKKARPNKTANVAPGNAVTLGQLLERSGAAADELLKPRAPARNRLDQRRSHLELC